MRTAVLLLAVVGLAGCDGAGVALSPDNTRAMTASTEVAMNRSYRLRDLRVVVPSNLAVSEANSYYPQTDIVWRGDPPGDRRAQIEALFEEASVGVAGALHGDRSVVADVVVTRFHGLTERTRYSIGGIYDIEFTWTVRDGATGEIIEPARHVLIEMPGPGGDAELELERNGLTERGRVLEFITQQLTYLLQ